MTLLSRDQELQLENEKRNKFIEQLLATKAKMSEPVYYCEWAPWFWRKRQNFWVVCEIEVEWTNGEKHTIKGRGAVCYQPYKKDLVPISLPFYEGLSHWEWGMKQQAHAARIDAMHHVSALKKGGHIL